MSDSQGPAGEGYDPPADTPDTSGKVKSDAAAANSGGQAKHWGLSPGQMLRQGREEQRLSLDGLAAKSKISLSALKAMENDDFQRLAEPVYTRGYYRRCARIVGLAEDDLMLAYEIYSGEPPPRPARPGTPSDEPFYRSRNWLPWVALLVSCALVAGLVWWTSRSVSSTPAASPSHKQGPTTPDAGASGGHSGSAKLGSAVYRRSSAHG